MARCINRGESILIPFRNGISISDSQLKPRMYKTRLAFEQQFPKHYLGTDGIELVEYVERKRELWVWGRNSMNQYGVWCTGCECGWEYKEGDFDRVEGLKNAHRYCPKCGAEMGGKRRSK